ncbi:MAG TPA: hypothetical protein VFU31_05425, partial [Candidatus Binatia bacterium]|nr:hypothetical protein [Candidatus Binatia bacterium]
IIGGSGYGSTARNCTLKSCYLYDDTQIGGLTSGCIDFTLQDCVIIGNVKMLYFGNLPTITDNKFYGTVAIKDGNNGGQVVDHKTLFPNNEYLSAVPGAAYLRANAYDATRANLTIFNGSQANTIEVDVSSIYPNGTQVQAINVQDYFNDIQNLTVAAGKITVNMQAENRTIAAPQGWTAPATVFPSFGCFVLVKQ